MQQSLGSYLKLPLSLSFATSFQIMHNILFQDNDSKHMNTYIPHFTKNNINWWKRPAESPDINPIELIWDSWEHFWGTIKSQEPCQSWRKEFRCIYHTKNIDHLHKVMPTVVQEGDALQDMELWIVAVLYFVLLIVQVAAGDDHHECKFVSHFYMITSSFGRSDDVII